MDHHKEAAFLHRNRWDRPRSDLVPAGWKAVDFLFTAPRDTSPRNGPRLKADRMVACRQIELACLVFPCVVVGEPWVLTYLSMRSRDQGLRPLRSPPWSSRAWERAFTPFRIDNIDGLPTWVVYLPQELARDRATPLDLRSDRTSSPLSHFLRSDSPLVDNIPPGGVRWKRAVVMGAEVRDGAVHYYGRPLEPERGPLMGLASRPVAPHNLYEMRPSAGRNKLLEAAVEGVFERDAWTKICFDEEASGEQGRVVRCDRALAEGMKLERLDPHLTDGQISQLRDGYLFGTLVNEDMAVLGEHPGKPSVLLLEWGEEIFEGLLEMVASPPDVICIAKEDGRGMMADLMARVVARIHPPPLLVVSESEDPVTDALSKWELMKILGAVSSSRLPMPLSRITTLYTKECKRILGDAVFFCSLPDHRERKGHKGALTHNPRPGVFWRGPLMELDFVGHYPSCIIAAQSSPEGRDVVSEIVRGLIERRKRAVEAGNHVEGDALKLLTNTAYGWLSFYFPRIAEVVTRIGRERLERLMAELEERGVEVVFADTDGLFVPDTPESRRVCEEIIRVFSLDGIELKIKRQFSCMFKAPQAKSYIALNGDQLYSSSFIYDNRDRDPILPGLVEPILKRFLEGGTDQATAREELRRLSEEHKDDVRTTLMLISEMLRSE